MFRIIFILEVFYLEVDFSFIRRSIVGYVTEDKRKRYDKENACNMTQVSDLDLGRHSVCFKSSQSLVIFNDLHNQIFRFSPSYFSHDRHDFYYDSPYFFDNS